jgi:hypothetical protein
VLEHLVVQQIKAESLHRSEERSAPMIGALIANVALANQHYAMGGFENMLSAVVSSCTVRKKIEII